MLSLLPFFYGVRLPLTHSWFTVILQHRMACKRRYFASITGCSIRSVCWQLFGRRTAC